MERRDKDMAEGESGLRGVGGGGKEVRGLIKSFKEQATNISLGLGHMVRADCLV